MDEARIQFDASYMLKSEDFSSLAKDFANISQTIDTANMSVNLDRISRTLKRMFNITTTISIIDQNTAPFFGFQIYPEYQSAENIVVSILSNNIPKVVETWKGTTNWTIEIDSKLLFNRTGGFNPKEIAILLLYRIEQVIFNYARVENITEIVRVSLTNLDYRNNAIVRSKVCRYLYMIPFMISCGWINYKQRLADDSLISLAGRDSVELYSRAWGNILSNYGMSGLLDRDSRELEGSIHYVLNWIFESVNDMKYSTRTLRYNLQKYINGVTSNYVKSVLKKIFIKFTNVSNTISALESVSASPKARELQEKLIDEHWAKVYKTVTESTELKDDFIDRHGLVKKVEDKEIDIIAIQIEEIESVDDKIYLIERIYKFLSIVNYSLELLNDPTMANRVKTSKSALVRQQSELMNLRKLVQQTRIPEQRYGLYIKYPVGYKG